MIRTIVFLILGVFYAAANPTPVTLFEDLITKELRLILAPYDPLAVPEINNLKITTDHADIFFSGTDVGFTGFSTIQCTKFNPPVLTKKTTMALKFGALNGKTPSYTMTGEFDGQPYNASGAGELSIDGMAFTVVFRMASYSLSPLSVCMEPGTFDIQITADTIWANFEGADEVTQDINEHGMELLEQIEAQINARGPEIEAAVNKLLCKTF